LGATEAQEVRPDGSAAGVTSAPSGGMVAIVGWEVAMLEAQAAAEAEAITSNNDEDTHGDEDEGRHVSSSIAIGMQRLGITAVPAFDSESHDIRMPAPAPAPWAETEASWASAVLDATEASLLHMEEQDEEDEEEERAETDGSPSRIHSPADSDSDRAVPWWLQPL